MSTGEGDATGIVLSADGLILTNNHVISGAIRLSVTDPATGRHFGGHVVGSSVIDDTALIQLSGAQHPTPASLGDSEVFAAASR